MASVWEELKRRNVVRVGLAYLAAFWLILQVADITIPVLGWPDWLLRALFFSAALGFPLALLLAWFYEITPEGIRTAAEVEVTKPVRFTGRRLDFVIIGLLVVAVGALLVRPPAEQIDVLPNSVAVLPFENLSPDPQDAYFATGLHDEVLNHLAKLGNLSVISRTSVSRYAESNLSVPEIARELNVGSVMEGTVRYADGRVRITTQLIDAVTDEHLWSQTYEREFSNIFAIESDIAISIANALETALSPDEARRINAVPTNNTAAYEFYLSGKTYFNNLDDRQFTPLAVRQLQRAVDEDPTFALAWADLARARLRMIRFDLADDAEQLALAKLAIDTALALSPSTGEPYLALASYHNIVDQDFSAALEALAIAEERMPGNAEIYLTRTYVQRRSGNERAALDSVTRALELDPHNVNLTQTLFGIQRTLRYFDEADATVNRMIELAPDNSRYRRAKALLPLMRSGDFEPSKAAASSSQPLSDREDLGWLAALYERDYDLALSYLDAWQLATPELQERPWARSALYGVTYALAGRDDLARSQFESARAQIQHALSTTVDDAELLVDLGEVLAGLGETDAALRAADRAMALARQSADVTHVRGIQGNLITRVLGPAGAVEQIVEALEEYLQLGPWTLEAILLDPRLDPVSGDPLVQKLVERHSQ